MPIENLINFEDSMSEKNSWIVQNILYFPSIFFGSFKEVFFENFNISTNNVISVEAAKVLWYYININVYTSSDMLRCYFPSLGCEFCYPNLS